MEIKINNVEEIKEYLVKSRKTAGYIYLPKNWIGKRVKIVLLEE